MQDGYTDLTIIVYIWMKHFLSKFELRRVVRVVVGKINGGLQNGAFVKSVLLSHNNNAPFEQVLLVN